MRVQFMAAVILGLTLSPAPVFGCTCAAPPPEVKTASELAAWTRADAIFEGKVESVELRWKLKEAQIGDVIPTVATDLDQNGPVILVSLEILHSYRGDQRKPMRHNRYRPKVQQQELSYMVWALFLLSALFSFQLANINSIRCHSIPPA